jgi:hypothetical protein
MSVSTNKISVNNVFSKHSLTNGDFSFGVNGGDDYGPTYQTNFYNGINISYGGYAIYVNNSGTITAHAPKDDNECLYYLNRYGANASNISDALTWASTQSYLSVRTSQYQLSDLGTVYTTWGGLNVNDNPYNWTTQQYGADTISIPWQWGGYNMTQSRPISGQIVSDNMGNSATILSVNNNAGGGGMNLLIYLTTSVPGFANDTSITIR